MTTSKEHFVGHIITPDGRPQNVEFISKKRPNLTPEERAAGIGWVDSRYDPGNVLRYGPNTIPGTTDMTTALQNAVNSNDEVIVPEDIVLSSQGTMTYRSTLHSYCVLVPSNTKISNGATITQANASNAHLFVNDGIEGAGNDNIEIVGGVLDCNQANQTSPATGEQSGMLFHDITRLKVDNVKFTNVREYATRITGITNGTFTNLQCTDSDGSGFSFGLNTSPAHRMTSCHFDNIYVEGCLGGFAGALGNGFILTGDRCSIGTVEHIDCRFGIKIQDGSSEVTIDSLICTGTTADYGVKILGGASLPDTQIAIGSIVTSGNFQSGAFFEDYEDVSVGRIISNNDATNDTTPAVWIGAGSRFMCDSISINDANNAGLNFRSDSTHANVGSVTVRNSGQSTGAPNVSVQGDDVMIGQLMTIDDQTGVETVTRGIDVASTCNACSIDSISAIGAFTFRSVVHNDNVVIGQVITDQQVAETFTTSDTTPSVVSGAQLFRTADTTTYTNFDQGWDGQTINLLANHAATVTHGTNIFTSTAANKTLTVNVVYTFVRDGGVWYEKATA